MGEFFCGQLQHRKTEKDWVILLVFMTCPGKKKKQVKRGKWEERERERKVRGDFAF